MFSRAWGRKYGVRLDYYPGPWVSLGVHVHVWPLKQAHIDLHLPQVIVSFGRHDL
jgi:hypothetical protein